MGSRSAGHLKSSLTEMALDEHRKVRILAHAVQHYGANPEEAKAALEDPGVGWDERQSDRTLGQAAAMYANTKGGRHGR